MRGKASLDIYTGQEKKPASRVGAKATLAPLVKRSMRISRTTLSCCLLFMLAIASKTALIV